MINIRTLKKEIANMQSGDTFYFNAVSASFSMIDYIRQLIIEGTIAPEQTELDKVIKKECQYRYQSGEALAPQMVYIVK